jgi:type IV secretion system protein VirB4
MASFGNFNDHLPWSFITEFREGVVVQKDGLIQRTFGYRAPDLDSSGAYEAHALCMRINDVTKRLGKGWAFFIEAQRYMTTDYPAAAFNYPRSAWTLLAPYLIDRERERTFAAAGRHFDSSYYITFVYKPPAESVKKLTRMFVDLGHGGKNGTLKENIDYFVQETEAILGILRESLLITALSNEQTLMYLHSAVSFERHYLKIPERQPMLDRILADTPLITSMTMKLGKNYIPIIGVNDFPDETYPAMLDDLNRAKLEYRWVTRYVCLGKESALKEIQKKEKYHRGNRKTILQTLGESMGGEPVKTVNHGASVKEQDSIDAGIEVETDGATLGFYTTCIMVWDENLEIAKKKADAVKAIINSKGFSCKEETFNGFEAFKGMMAGQVYANMRAQPVMSYTLSHCIPLSSVWSGMRYNEHAGKVTGCDLPHVICSTHEGTPFFLNINPTDVGHTAVWGPTGAGKSTFLNLLEAQFFKYPESQIIVFDKGKSCRQLCLAVGGEFYEPAGEGLGAVNFQPLRDLESDYDMMAALDFIECLFTANKYDVTPPMRAAMKESVELLKDKPKNNRTLTDFTHYVNYLDPEMKRPIFKEQLGDYLVDGGKYGKIFDAKSSGIRLDNRFIAIEMEDLMNRGEECLAPALVYLFAFVEKKFDGRLTMLVLDEAWLFLKNPVFAEKIAEWLKVLRKKNVFVVFATQDVADVVNSPLKTAITQQCLTKIYLADPAAVTPGMTDVYRAFGLSSTEINLIAGARMKRDYFYTSPLGRRMFQLDLGRLQLALIGGADHAMLDYLVRANPAGTPLCEDILRLKRIPYHYLINDDAPKDKPAYALRAPPSQNADDAPAQEEAREADAASTGFRTITGGEILEAVQNGQTAAGKQKRGAGRTAEREAARLGISAALYYKAQKIAQNAPADIIDKIKSGDLSIAAAYKTLRKSNAGA